MVERYRPYQEKKQMYALIVVIVIMILALIFFRILLGEDEDTWVCSEGVWIEHGKPSSPMPTYKCN